MKLEPGDVFFQTSGNILDIIINFFQSLWSGDNRSIFSHCGIILYHDGETFETTGWRTGFGNLSTRQGNKTIVAIYRHREMRELAFDFSARLAGRIYPYWRLPIFALGLGRLIHGTNMVCSELVAEFLKRTGVRSKSPWGVSVDRLHDELQADNNWKLVYQGFGWEGGE